MSARSDSRPGAAHPAGSLARLVLRTPQAGRRPDLVGPAGAGDSQSDPRRGATISWRFRQLWRRNVARTRQPLPGRARTPSAGRTLLVCRERRAACRRLRRQAADTDERGIAGRAADTGKPGGAVRRSPRVAHLIPEHPDEQTRMKRILILGVNGFIGHHLTRAVLAKTDWHVYGMDLQGERVEPFLRDPRFHFV